MLALEMKQVMWQGTWQPLEESQPTASKEMGPRSYNFKKLNSVTTTALKEDLKLRMRAWLTPWLQACETLS